MEFESNEVFEENTEKKEDDNIPSINEIRMPFTPWNVDGTEYRLKLRTLDICKIETKLGVSCVSLVAGAGDEMPKLVTMLQVIHAAMDKFHHGKTLDDVFGLFDRYEDAGGSQQDLYVDVFMPLFINSGFFNLKQTQALRKVVEDMKA